MENVRVRSAREDHARGPAAEPGVRPSLAAALVDLSPRAQQVRSLGQMAAAAQLKVKTKGSMHGDKVDGTIKSLRDEVAETIARDKAGELLDDIAAVKASITSRKAELATFKSGTDEYARHEGRITAEGEQLVRLEDAYAANKAARKKA